MYLGWSMRLRSCRVKNYYDRLSLLTFEVFVSVIGKCLWQSLIKCLPVPPMALKTGVKELYSSFTYFYSIFAVRSWIALWRSITKPPFLHKRECSRSNLLHSLGSPFSWWPIGFWWGPRMIVCSFGTPHLW